MRGCEYCGKELARNIRGDGRKESKRQFEKRITCGAVCARQGQICKKNGVVATPRVKAAQLYERLKQMAISSKVMGS